MMDERRIEAALRAEPPDEPTYIGDVAAALRSPRSSAPQVVTPAEVLEFDGPAGRRRSVAVLGAVAAAVVLVVALAVVVRPRSNPSVTTSPTPTTAMTTPSTSEPPIAPGRPSELVGRWVGATPPSLTTPNPAAPAFVVFGEDQVSLEHLSGGIVNDFVSQFAISDDGRIELTLSDQIGRCAPGATGDYRWSLSPGRTVLTLEEISDECPGRAAALAGEWAHIGCPSRGDDCLGPLEAGRHSSVNFDPFDSDSYGEMTYVVADGWSSTVDDKARLTLVPPGSDDSGVHGVHLYADVASAGPNCAATPGPESGADAIASAISSMPGLSVDTSPATVDTYPAQVLDVVAETSACTAGRPLLTSRSGSSTPWTVSIGEGRRMRIVLVDLPSGGTMAVVIASDRSDSEYALLLAAATPVIDSIVLSSGP
jgi:hypothetical protein